MDVVALAQAGFENAVATLGTACTAEHVQKLFRFTESIVFSFDGDAAGRKAAARALEASLAFATDVRTVRFLFLPPEHDPDSYVRELGAPAFEACVAAALPLSRQLLDVAAQGCDLQHAEGRARMLAQARPLWTALPAGAVKHQLLDEIAAQARMTRTDLQGLWGATGGDSSTARGAHGRRDVPAGARQWSRRPSQGAASLLDRALWLLVNRTGMWDDIGPDAQTFLCEQPPPHGPAAARIERQVHDDGPLDRQRMLELLRDPELGPQAQAFADRLDHLLAPEPDTDFGREFALVLNRLRLAAVEEELKSLFEAGTPSPDALQRSQQLRQVQIQLKSTAAAPGF
jgi:DNA primase